MSYKEHAMQEFKAAGWIKKNGKWSDEMQELICKQILELLEIFSKHGHSGLSAPYAINLFKTLASFNPISPLTGRDDEWGEPFDGNGTKQNKRDSSVFKDENGDVYWAKGKIFKDKDGSTWINGDSRVEISFPWRKPEPEIIEREK